MPGATGIMGDLGGGSLELVEIHRGRIGRQATLPLGTMRLSDAYVEDPKAIVRLLRDALSGVAWLGERRRANFYPVGGSWRALARLHIERADHPLLIIHDYALPAAEIANFAASISRLRPSALGAIKGFSRRRARHLPYAAMLLAELVEATGPRTIRFCSTGVREGVVHSRLPEEVQARDVLLSAAEALGRREARFPEFAEVLFDWLAPLVARKRWRRLALAACHLADISWREHPEYRAEQALLRVVRHNYLAAAHGERAFLGLAVFGRYGGDLAASAAAKRLGPLLGEDGRQRAEILGRAMRPRLPALRGLRGAPWPHPAQVPRGERPARAERRGSSDPARARRRRAGPRGPRQGPRRHGPHDPHERLTAEQRGTVRIRMLKS